MPMRLKSFTILPAVLASALAAAQTDTVEQQVRDEMQLVLVRMIESGAFAGKSADQIAFTLDEPERRVTNLGLVVDSASGERAHDGLRVLAVSPRSSAQKMGIRTGDTLTAVNGTPLARLGADANGHARAASVLREVVDASAETASLSFALRRNGQDMTVSGALASVTLPPIHLKVGRGELLADAGSSRNRRRQEETSFQGCGHLSVFDVAPRGQRIYGVKLLSIDGEVAGPGNSPQFRVAAGPHTLEIAELIDPEQLSFNSRQRGDNARKTLNVTVQANTTYYLGAKLDPSRRSEWKDGAYWEPVVWKEAPGDCR
ncbi:PDZ domain-containing protein [Tahibacter amnicola]|uniref:PDZ domain-containing protein n=1 Tax=Tahibacter amnicola TaxID=2976241 RepID=A0ABY6BEG3_9GAMM|nr:PDZ domain-containing protein [Tahibacter amnicola]UXI68418.1 PDZ domain-containing protein [Tahibacter amnicola]